MPTLFETINQRADDIKLTRWQTYTPLTQQQLTDYDSVADEPVIDPDPLPDWITILTVTADPNPPTRSTLRSAQKHKQFIVLKRPTELMAVAHGQGQYVLDDDYPFKPAKRPRMKRWCIYCEDRHPLAAFNKETRYLHGLSYACKQSQNQHRRFSWYYASLKSRFNRLTTLV